MNQSNKKMPVKKIKEGDREAEHFSADDQYKLKQMDRKFQIHGIEVTCNSKRR